MQVIVEEVFELRGVGRSARAQSKIWQKANRKKERKEEKERVEEREREHGRARKSEGERERANVSGGERADYKLLVKARSEDALKIEMINRKVFRVQGSWQAGDGGADNTHAA